MTREEFQRLVSAWLDAPRDRALRVAVARALRSDPALRAEFSAWQRMDAILRNLPTPTAGRRLKSRKPPSNLSADELTRVPVGGSAPDAPRP